MNTHLVSIIVPIYNVEKYLQTCINSILNQSYENMEIILVDDGSTDESGAIADNYLKQDARIKVIHQNNSGVSAARNTGIENAAGDYICFADSDDILEKDYVEYLLNLCLQNNVEIALTTEMFTTFYKTSQTKKDRIRLYSGEDTVKKILYYDIPIGCYCKIFSRTFLQRHNILFRTDLYIGEGFNFNVTAFKYAQKVAIGQRKIYCYRRDNSSSAMTKFAIHKASMALKAIDEIEKTLKTDNRFVEAHKYAKWHTSDDMYNWMILANAKKDYPEMFSKCYQTTRSYSFKAIFAPVNLKERYRAFICFVHPRLFALQLQIRRMLF